MVVDQQGFVCARAARWQVVLAVYNRGPGSVLDLYLKTALLEHFGYQPGAFLQTPILRGYTGLRNQTPKLFQALVKVFIDKLVYSCEIRHRILL